MFYIVFVLLTAIPAWSGVRMMNPTARLKGNISADSLNRIAVVNDRITHVFGDQDAYEVMMDEAIGQVFLKPTTSNGLKPISLSFVTESQCTQDLLLTPSAIDASTLLFRNPSPNKKTDTPHIAHSEPVARNSVLCVMKRWVLDESERHEGEKPSPHPYSGCTTTLIAFKEQDGYTVSRWRVHNDTSTPIVLTTEDFYQKGDHAVAMEHTTLEVNQGTTVYVVGEVHHV